MRVRVTGGAGYIGSHVARELARHGYEVVIYDISTGHRFLADGFPCVIGNISDPKKLVLALNGAVFPFAICPSNPAKLTLSLIQKSRTSHVRFFFHFRCYKKSRSGHNHPSQYFFSSHAVLLDSKVPPKNLVRLVLSSDK